MMKRINPADAPEIFRRLKIEPAFGRWGDEKCGCLTIALAADTGTPYEFTTLGSIAELANKWDKNGERNGNAAAKLARGLGLKTDYVLGLIYGWDDIPLDIHPLHTNKYIELTQAGWADGQAARFACNVAACSETK